jgi:hypothetical protein
MIKVSSAFTNPSYDKRIMSWNGTPERHPDAFTMIKQMGGETRNASCQVWSHVAGWEVRLDLAGYGLLAQAVVPTVTAVMETSAEWSKGLRMLGWEE